MTMSRRSALATLGAGLVAPLPQLAELPQSLAGNHACGAPSTISGLAKAVVDYVYWERHVSPSAVTVPFATMPLNRYIRRSAPRNYIPPLRDLQQALLHEPVESLNQSLRQLLYVGLPQAVRGKHLWRYTDDELINTPETTRRTGVKIERIVTAKYCIDAMELDEHAAGQLIGQTVLDLADELNTITMQRRADGLDSRFFDISPPDILFSRTGYLLEVFAWVHIKTPYKPKDT